MSPNNFSGLEMPCDQVKHALLLLVDGRDFFEANEIDPISVDKHLERCAPCKLEVEAEKMVHHLMQSLLKRSCNEKAPESLIDSIHQQLQAAMFQQSAPQVVTEFRMSQVSIEIDEFGQVIQREIHIESTQEFHDPEAF
jgi:transcriptional regulator NrdR family protein